MVTFLADILLLPVHHMLVDPDAYLQVYAVPYVLKISWWINFRVFCELIRICENRTVKFWPQKV